jgi:hypothetical protein
MYTTRINWVLVATLMTLSLSERMHNGRAAAQPQRHPMRRQPLGAPVLPARTAPAGGSGVRYLAYAAYGTRLR